MIAGPGRGSAGALPRLLAGLAVAGSLLGCGGPERQARAEIRERAQDTGVRILVVGLDGADWQIADPLIERGLLPNLAALRARGAWGPLKAPMPMLSPLIWTSVATGVTPERHGVVDFLVPGPEPGSAVPVSRLARRVPALWNAFSAAGRSVDVVAWWATWPAERVDGHVVSDRVSYSLFDVDRPGSTEGLTYPAGYYDTIRPRLVTADQIPAEEVASFVDVTPAELAAAREAAAGSGGASYEDPVVHLTRILAATHNYHTVALDLLQRGQSDLVAVYYQLLDEVGHRFMHFAPPPMEGIDPHDVQRFGRAVERAYVYQDQLLGELLAAVDPATTVVVLSDHGFVNGPDRFPGETADVEARPGRWHRRYGIVVLAGPPVAPVRLPPISPLDVAPTVLYLAGLPVAEDLTGRVLDEAIRPDFRQRWPETRIASYAPAWRPPEAADVASSRSAATDAEMLENLRALGYVADPDERSDAKDAVTSHVNLAAVHASAGRLDDAERELQAALALAPDYPRARLQLFHLRYRQRRLDDAIEIGSRLVNQPEAHNTLFLNRLARAYQGAGRTDDGIRFLREQVARGNDSVGPALAALLLASGDSEGARRQAEAVLDRDLLDELAMDTLFDIARKQNRVADLEPRLAAALAVNERSVAHLNWLAFVREDAGDLPGAERLLLRALDADPEHAGTLANLGRVLLVQNRVEEAVPVLERAVQVAPGSPVARRSLAAALTALGRQDEARAVANAGADGTADDTPSPPRSSPD